MATNLPATADMMRTATLRDPACAAAYARYERAHAAFSAAAAEARAIMHGEYAPTEEWVTRMLAAWDAERVAYDEAHAAGVALNDTVRALVCALAALPTRGA